MSQNNGLTLECLAIGSLPHNNVDKAIDLVRRYFGNIPFWPQMTQLSKNEDMILQFTENLPSFFADECVFKPNKKEIENFLADYNEIIFKNSLITLEKYGLSDGYAAAFKGFLKLLKKTKPNYAKGQVTGAFTLSTTVKSGDGNYAFFAKLLKDVIVKMMSLKALWQIQKIKEASPETTPIIFIDEPNLSYLGSLKFTDIKEIDVVDMIKSVSDTIKENGAMSGLHCCGNCDWAIVIKSGVDIINLNVLVYEKDLDLYIDDLKEFFRNGGKVVWSTVPTMNRELLKRTDLADMLPVFENAVKNLTKKGIDEKIIMENSLISSSCGMGTLSEELAEKAMRLVKELSDNRKAIWRSN